MPDSTADQYGPIDFLVVEFPSGTPEPSGFEMLLTEVDAGHIRILDVEFVTRDGDRVTACDPSSFDVPSVRAFVGASSGLLDVEDMTTLVGELTDGAVAVVVVYEEIAILRAVRAWTGGGGRLVMEGHLTPDDLDAALDATEPA